MMNNKDFISELSRRTGFTTVDTQKLVSTIVRAMGDSFQAGESIVIDDFGTFEVKKRLERVVMNPTTQQRMLVPPKLTLNFKPTTSIKGLLKKGGADHD